MKKILLALVLIGLLAGGWLYWTVAVDPVLPAELAEPAVIDIPRGASYAQVVDSLRALGVAINPAVLDPLAERMNWRRPQMRSGRFELTGGMTHLELIRKLRGGSQQPIEVVLTTEREPMNVAAKAARFLAADSVDFVRLFRNEAYLDSIGYTPENFMTLFIPNTYELYWNASPREFVARMVREHQKFWKAGNRLEKARALGMTPAEVYTLASIVERESLQPAERPRIAGVYLNRLRNGIKLQADPTAVFATREFDVGRVLYRHIEYDSPYNTYRYKGLPPGPITMASVGSIDAVLNPEDHEYIYFCARGDGTGYHNFARTGAGHNRNRAVYVANLRARGIR